jgi:predicted O-linked N-acetylglucosamine transferase (SPINDLY family)
VALERFRAAGRAIPRSAAHINSMGVAYLSLGNAGRAAACFRRASRLDAGNADIFRHLGRALWTLGRREPALAAFQKAVDLDPRQGCSRNALATALLAVRRTTEALEHAQAAVALDANDVDGLCVLANCLGKANRISEASLASERALALQPGNAGVWSNLGGFYAEEGRWQESIASFCRAAELSHSPAIHSNLLLVMHYGGFTPGQIFAEHRRWAELHYPGPAVPRAFDRDRSAGRRLRVGYVSADFRDHSVSFLIEPVLAAHDRLAIEPFLYSTAGPADLVTERIRSYGAHWHGLAGIDDAQAAELIASHQIDILVDLSGHTAGNRLGIFARKPAPIQATYCGYPDTTGLPSIDYRITDESCDPPALTEHLHTERLWRITPGFVSFRPPDDAPSVSALPAEKNGYITFGCFAIRQKITAEMLSAWASILQQVPDSRLILKNRQVADAAIAEAIRKRFTDRGLAAQRIEFRGNTARRDHIRHHADIDIMLDTFPYNGTIMTCEALWMGVPVLSLAGTSHAARVGLSLLSRLGLAGWVARSHDEYVQRAVAVAGDRAGIARLRQTLRGEFARSSLGDPGPVTRALEDAYRDMWRAWLDLTGSGYAGRTSPEG